MDTSSSSLGSSVGAVGTSISVAVRLRPISSKDGPEHHGMVIDQERAKVVITAEGDKRTTFSFNQCYDESSTQEQVFESVLPMLEQVYRGINATIICYGVTGSGKTHSMQGSPSSPGLIPRTIKSIFARQQSEEVEWLVKFSYVEILKDEAWDLLGDRAEAKKLDIRTNAKGDNVVADLTVQSIDSIFEFEQLYQVAAKSRKTASTKLNSSSSRSHAILTFYVEIPDGDKSLTGKISLVDLAGSENNKLTGNDPERMRESAAINKSLTVLGNVVDALNKRASRVPYRDSKLTRVLQDALGGSAAGLLICCLAPGEKFAKDTLNTLNFATRTKQVENVVAVNERDNRPVPKAHFAAYTPAAVSAPRPSLPAPRQSMAPPRQSMAPPRQSLAPRPSVAASGSGARSAARASMAAPARSAKPTFKVYDESSAASSLRSALGSTPVGMTDDELEAKIAGILEKKLAQAPQQPARRLADFDAIRELALRLDADEKRQRGRVFVDLARKHQAKGDLQDAVEHYQKAFILLPDNAKLGRRILEVQMAIEGLARVPTPDPAPILKRSRLMVDITNSERGVEVLQGKGGKAESHSIGKEEHTLKRARMERRLV